LAVLPRNLRAGLFQVLTLITDTVSSRIVEEFDPRRFVDILKLRSASCRSGGKTSLELQRSASNLKGKDAAMRKCVPALLALVWLLGASPFCPAQEKPVKSILVLHEGWEKWPSNALVNAQLQEAFGRDNSFEEQFFQEYVDEWRLGRSIPEMAEALHRKYAIHRLDLIVAVGFTPFNLLVSQGAKFFPGVPVVFVSVGDYELPRGGLPGNITGVTAHLDVPGTVDLALRLQPDTRNLFLVSGSSEYEHFSSLALQPQLRSFAGRLHVAHLSDLTLEQLLGKVAQLPDHSVIFFLTMLKDAAGHSYVPAQVCSLISVSANAPVYALLQTDMDRGIVGGSMYNIAKDAREAAGLALQILKGANIKDLPVRPGPPNEITVDWRQLQRWRIPESRLPKNAVVLFSEPGTWQTYHWYILGAIAVVLLQALLIAALLAQARRRAAAERDVKRRLDFETLMSETLARFIHLPVERIEAEIDRGLERLRLFLGVDRVTLYDRFRPGMDFTALHYAAQERTGLSFPVLTQGQFPGWMERLKGGDALLVEQMGQVPDLGEAEREVARKGIKSFAVVPLKAEQSVLGLLVLATISKQRGWPRELVPQLQILGDIFYQAVLRKRAEAAARESEGRFALMADSAPMLLWMSGTDKRCNYFNKGWFDFTGRTLEQELGDGWVEGVHPEDREGCFSSYSQAFDLRQGFKLEYRLRRHDGEYRWIMDCGVPRYSPDRSFCGYIGSCIDITDLKLSQQEMEELSGRLIHAQEEERKRVARELHDNFGQKLVVLSMELAQHLSRPENPPQIEAWLRDLGEKLKEISRAMNVTAHQLHSSHLEVLGLVSAVQGLCHEFSRQYGIEAAFSHSGMPFRVPSEVALCLFRVVQEGLQNIAKHSGALSCRVEITGSREGIHLCISDSGIGFDSARLKLKPGLGFVSMRERLRLVGGQITVESQPTRGTRLDIRVPIAAMTTAA
jgi:PAS domain S-box-containing protein